MGSKQGHRHELLNTAASAKVIWYTRPRCQVTKWEDGVDNYTCAVSRSTQSAAVIMHSHDRTWSHEQVEDHSSRKPDHRFTSGMGRLRLACVVLQSRMWVDEYSGAGYLHRGLVTRHQLVCSHDP
jgi:hypothetical protein